MYVDFSGDQINLEAFRTAVWRMQKKIIPGVEKSAWIVKSEKGKYWREEYNLPLQTQTADEAEDHDFDPADMFEGGDDDESTPY